MNPDKPDTWKMQTWFTRLESAPLTADETRTLREALKTVTKDEVVLDSVILRMQVDTSQQMHKQIYLLVPKVQTSREHPVIGMECWTDCLPIDSDPMFFHVLPLS
jgi:hypothetical protein